MLVQETRLLVRGLPEASRVARQTEGEILEREIVFTLDLHELWIGSFKIGDIASYLDTDETLSANSDARIATQRATKVYITAGLATRAPLASPAFTGIPTVPTADPGTNTTQAASTAFVIAVRDNLLDAAPGQLDTINELATALGNDANFASTITTALAARALVVRTITGEGLATGGGSLEADQVIMVPKATQEQAEAGEVDDVAMTPLSTAQAISAQTSGDGIATDGSISDTTGTNVDIDEAIATAINNLVDASPGQLNTLNELAAALGNDANFAATVSSAIGTLSTEIDSVTTDVATALSTANLAAPQTVVDALQTSVDSLRGISGIIQGNGSGVFAAAVANTDYATPAAVASAISDALNTLVDGAPGQLDTLDELATAINDDASFAATLTAAIGTAQTTADGAILNAFNAQAAADSAATAAAAAQGSADSAETSAQGAQATADAAQGELDTLLAISGLIKSDGVTSSVATPDVDYATPEALSAGLADKMDRSEYDSQALGFISGHSSSGTSGGFLDMDGGEGGNGGNINTSGGINNGSNGGDVDTHGDSQPGGKINTSNGGGLIDTTGLGLIQFGEDGQRTTLQGTASENHTLSLPDQNGTLVAGTQGSDIPDVSETSVNAGADLVDLAALASIITELQETQNLVIALLRAYKMIPV